MLKITMTMAASAALMLGAFGSPSIAAVIVNSANTGFSFQVDYAGQVGGNAAPSVSALGTFTFTGVTNGGKT